MSFQSMVANPLSRDDIRKFTRKLRKDIGLDDKLYFPIVEFMELLPELCRNFNYEIIEIGKMGNCHGLMLPETSTIRIREDVYERAADGVGRDRSTIAHEIGHWFMHRNLAHARTDGTPLPAYKDPEWQAKAFAGELLVPAHLVQTMMPYEIAEKCGVSLEAAGIQKSKIPR